MKVVILLIMLIGALFTSCNNHKSQENECKLDLWNTAATGSVTINRWEHTQGDLVPTDIATLPHVECIIHDDYLLLNNVEYVSWDTLDDKWELWVESGWRIDLSMLSPDGVTEANDVVYLSSEEKPVLMVLYNITTNAMQPFLRKDFAETELLSFARDSFTFLPSTSTDVDNQMLEYIWLLHTTVVEYQTWGPVMDGGNYHAYTLTAICNKCPALLYNINFWVYETGEIHIQNLPSQKVIHKKAD